MDVRTFASGRLGFCQLFLRVEAPPCELRSPKRWRRVQPPGGFSLMGKEASFFPRVESDHYKM